MEKNKNIVTFFVFAILISIDISVYAQIAKVPKLRSVADNSGNAQKDSKLGGVAGNENILPSSLPNLPTPSDSNVTTSTTTPPPKTTASTTPITTPTPITTVPTTSSTTPPTTPTPSTSTIKPLPPSSTTTPSPPTPPKPDRSFDLPSFVGGIILALGILAIGYVVYKFYRARTDPNYRTL